MTFKEKVFLATALAYCVFGFTCVSLISTPIAHYIGKHGWKTFNGYFLPFLIFLLGMVTGFLVSRLWIRFPAWWQIGIAVLGAAVSAYVLQHIVLLTTELVHLPQFAMATLLFFAAFPKNVPAALACSIAICIGDEWTQSFLPNRVLDLNDILLNFIGLYIGLVIWWGLSVRPQNDSETATPVSR